MGTKKGKRSGSGSAVVAMTSADRMKLVRPRRGFEVYASRLVKVYRDHPDTLHTDGIDLAQLEEDLRQSAALVEPENDAIVAAQRLTDTRAFHQTRAYGTMLAMYDRAVSAARLDKSVGPDIEPLVVFMRTPRKKKGAAPPPVTPAPTPPTS